jgi:hypothetical protein
VDKRGRPVTFASSENYKKFYELTSSEEDDSDEEDGLQADDQQNVIIHCTFFMFLILLYHKLEKILIYIVDLLVIFVTGA